MSSWPNINQTPNHHAHAHTHHALSAPLYRFHISDITVPYMEGWRQTYTHSFQPLCLPTSTSSHSHYHCPVRFSGMRAGQCPLLLPSSGTLKAIMLWDCGLRFVFIPPVLQLGGVCALRGGVGGGGRGGAGSGGSGREDLTSRLGLEAVQRLAKDGCRLLQNHNHRLPDRNQAVSPWPLLRRQVALGPPESVSPPFMAPLCPGPVYGFVWAWPACCCCRTRLQPSPPLHVIACHFEQVKSHNLKAFLLFFSYVFLSHKASQHFSGFTNLVYLQQDL